MTSSKQLLLVALSTALLTTGANMWLAGGNAWASPKGADRGATKQTIDGLPQPAAGERYVVRAPFVVQPGSPDQPGSGAEIAYCDDLDDIAVSGSCVGLSRKLFVWSTSHVRWTSDTIKSGYACQLGNLGATQANAEVELVCERR